MGARCPRTSVHGYLIEEHILAERDEEKWEEAVAEQEKEREQIADVIERWNELFEEEA